MKHICDDDEPIIVENEISDELVNKQIMSGDGRVLEAPKDIKVRLDLSSAKKKIYKRAGIPIKQERED